MRPKLDVRPIFKQRIEETHKKLRKLKLQGKVEDLNDKKGDKAGRRGGSDESAALEEK